MPDIQITVNPGRLLLVLPAMLIGLVVGLVVGGLGLPYLVLQELIRKIGQYWSYLDGWVDWAEGRRNQEIQPRRGWLLVWLLWAMAYVSSVASWALPVGLTLGALSGAWCVLVPNGWSQMAAKGRELRDRFRALDLQQLL
jgi:hypothetical protein